MEALAVLGAAWPRLMESVHGRRLADGTSHGDVSGVRGEDWSSVISAVWIALGTPWVGAGRHRGWRPATQTGHC